jgi:hypothetical protein
MGKGDKDRTNKYRQFWDNYDKAFSKKKKRKSKKK